MPTAEELGEFLRPVAQGLPETVYGFQCRLDSAYIAGKITGSYLANVQNQETIKTLQQENEMLRKTIEHLGGALRDTML